MKHFLAITATAIIAVLCAQPIHAQPDDSTLAVVQRADPSILRAAAKVKTDPSQPIAIDSATAAVRTKVPSDPRERLSIHMQDHEFKLRLPFSERAHMATSPVPGVLKYDNRNGSETLPIHRVDGSLQVVTVIRSPEAPREFSYEFEFPEGTHVIPAGDSLLFVNEGRMIAGLAPAWARDAAGRDVPTHYSVDGSTVTQVVDHNVSFDYPVTADPWLGINLFSTITVDTYRSQPRVNLKLSPWGWAVYSGHIAIVPPIALPATIAAGQYVLNTAGWDEARSRSATVRNALDKPSQRQQFECHALGALFAGDWNLEKVRPNRTAHWSNGVAVHRCNWNTPNGY